MKVAIHQPNFLPWSGYFDKIQQVDTFIFLDDVQFERGKTFTSRTRILSNGSPLWLTVPVLNKSDLLPINSIRTDNSFNWQQKHLNTLFHAYKKSVNFESIYTLMEQIFEIKHDYLIDYNESAIKLICNHLEVTTKFIRSSSMECADKAGWDKLLGLILKSEADTYISGSGSGSKRYISQTDLECHGIKLKWQDFDQLNYPQINTPFFVSNLSIIDKLFNTSI